MQEKIKYQLHKLIKLEYYEDKRDKKEFKTLCRIYEDYARSFKYQMYKDDFKFDIKVMKGCRNVMRALLNPSENERLNGLHKLILENGYEEGVKKFKALNSL